MPLLKTFYRYLFVFIGGIIFLFFPLLRDFHIESAAIAGTLGAFFAAFSVLSNKKQNDLSKILQIIGYAYIFGIPMFFYALATGCLSIDGILFWIFTPIPSILFGAALGRLVRLWNIKYSSFLLLGIMLLFGIGALLFELKSYPQVYFFNHIWGYFPGPIYDEVIHFPKNYFYFRLLTLFWVILLWFWPNAGYQKTNQFAVAVGAALMIIFYANSANLGFISPNKYLQSQLKNHISTQHFDVYYPDSIFDDQEVEYWVQKHEFYFHEITKQLEIDWPEGQKIDSYIYAHPWQKKELVGAKYTSYVPIWLKKDQTHIAKQHLKGVLKHELVHIIAKQFGNKLYNGSNNIGLIEGLAEAVAADRSLTATLDEILAAKPNYPKPDEMMKALSNTGFYSGASSICYSTAGSFIQYLLEKYPVDNFKKTYPKANFDDYYPIPFNQLVNEWHEHLKTIEVDSVSSKVSENIMSQRSVFEKKCPHTLNPELKLLDSYHHYLTDKDTLRSLDTIDTLTSSYPNNNSYKNEKVRLYLESGLYKDIIHFIPDNETILDLKLLKADALSLMGKQKAALDLLASIKMEIDTLSSKSYKLSYKIRANTNDFEVFLALRYKNTFPTIDSFQKSSNYLKKLVILQAIEQNQYKKLGSYLPFFDTTLWDEFTFNQTLDILDSLVFMHFFGESEQILNRLKLQNLRPRYLERIKEQQNWFDFTN